MVTRNDAKISIMTCGYATGIDDINTDTSALLRHRCNVGFRHTVPVSATDTDSGEPTKPNDAGSGSDRGWLLLVYRIPAEPTRLRATVWRRLKSLGAVYLQNSAAALPADGNAERALRRLRREILEMNGTAVLLSCSAVAGAQDVIALFQAARDSEYDEILDKCVDFHAGLDKEYAANHFTYGELEENEVELVKLRNWYEKVQTRDAYGAPKRSEASQALDACSDALELYAARVYDEEDEGR